MTTDKARLNDLLPADPIEMTSDEIAAVASQLSVSEGTLQRIVDGMRAARDNPDDITPSGGGSNRWYWATYLRTPELRRRHVLLHATACHIG